MTKHTSYIGKMLNNFSWGAFVVQKFMWVINMAILIKVYDIPFYIQLIVVPLIVAITLTVGMFIVKTGIQKSYIDNRFKDSRMMGNNG